MPANADPKLDSLLEQAVVASKAGNLARARGLLIAALKIDPKSEQGWLWLAGTLTDPDERRACLEKVLAIDPANDYAREGLRWPAEHPPGPQSAGAPPATQDSVSSLPPADVSADTDLALRTDHVPPAPAAAPSPRSRPVAPPCPWCHAEISSLDVKCPVCGRHLEFDCPDCEYGVPLEETQCPKCGRVAGDFRQPQAYLQNLGEAYFAKGQFNKALPVCLYLAELDPQNPRRHVRLSQLYSQLNRTEESVAAAERALELDPANAEALERLGYWYVKRGLTDKTAALVDRLNKLEARPPGLTLVLADIEFERRQYPAAFRAYSQALAAPDFDAPALARIHYRLGEMYLVAEDPMAALKSFQACVATQADLLEVQEAQRRIEQIRPPLPPGALESGVETLRAMAGPLLMVWITGALEIGFRFQRITLPGLVGLLAAVLGSYLLASAVSTPLRWEWRTLLGPQGLTQPRAGKIVALFGSSSLIIAFSLVLFGM